ncbi:MAG: hypothetical protein UF228_09125 [Lachnospiraceae bacterium]|nr:hypothetical protein [Lachnospiraceae bacterium]
MIYEEYLTKNDALTLEKADEILSRIEASLDKNDEDAIELYNDFLEGAVAYANVRAGWLLLSNDEKMEQDKGRTYKHDSVINRVNILARYLDKIGKDVSWREALGESRKAIGDFACYVSLVYGLRAR